MLVIVLVYVNVMVPTEFVLLIKVLNLNSIPVINFFTCYGLKLLYFPVKDFLKETIKVLVSSETFVLVNGQSQLMDHT